MRFHTVLSLLLLTNVACGDLINAAGRAVAPAPAQPVQAPALGAGDARRQREMHETEERNHAAMEKRTADQKHEKDEKEERRASALAAKCEASRPVRLADLKEKIKDYHAEIKKLAPHVEWIEKHCKQEDTRGVLVERERTKSGVIVRTKAVGLEEDVTCNAPMPAGLTKGRAARIIYWNTLEPTDSVNLNYDSDRNDFGQENSLCAAVDRAAGIDLHVTMSDFEGQKAILAK